MDSHCLRAVVFFLVKILTHTILLNGIYLVKLQPNHPLLITAVRIYFSHLDFLSLFCSRMVWQWIYICFISCTYKTNIHKKHDLFAFVFGPPSERKSMESHTHDPILSQRKPESWRTTTLSKFPDKKHSSAANSTSVLRNWTNTWRTSFNCV